MAGLSGDVSTSRFSVFVRRVALHMAWDGPKPAYGTYKKGKWRSIGYNEIGAPARGIYFAI